METTKLQNIVFFIEKYKKTIDNSIKYDIEKKKLNEFTIQNELSVNTYYFLFNNLINHDIENKFNKDLLTKAKINPTGITVNFLLLLFCIWEDSQYLTSIKNVYFSEKVRLSLKQHIQKLLYLQISGDVWIKFKNYILIYSKKKLTKEEYDGIYNVLTTKTNSKLQLRSIDTTEEKEKNNTSDERLRKIESKMGELEKHLA